MCLIAILDTNIIVFYAALYENTGKLMSKKLFAYFLKLKVKNSIDGFKWGTNYI